ncbi:MAG: hypothetical protein AAFO01_04160 [Pseudomonadota bacterium]
MLQSIRPFIEFYRLASFASPPWRGVDVGRLRHGIMLGWEAAKRYRRLSIMNNDELAHLGLDRESIGRYAFFGDQPWGRP